MGDKIHGPCDNLNLKSFQASNIKAQPTHCIASHIFLHFSHPNPMLRCLSHAPGCKVSLKITARLNFQTQGSVGNK